MLPKPLFCALCPPLFLAFPLQKTPDPQTRHAAVPADPQTLLTPKSHRPTDPSDPQTHRPLRPTDPSDPQTHRHTDSRPPDHREGSADCAERLNPPPPACRGAGRVEYQSDFVKLSSEGPRTFRRPRRAGAVLAPIPLPRCHPRASDGLQNAVLEPPMASRSPNSANVCKTLLN